MEQPDAEIQAICERIDARLLLLSHTFAEIDRALGAAIKRVDHAMAMLKREQD